MSLAYISFRLNGRISPYLVHVHAGTVFIDWNLTNFKDSHVIKLMSARFISAWMGVNLSVQLQIKRNNKQDVFLFIIVTQFQHQILKNYFGLIQ